MSTPTDPTAGEGLWDDERYRSLVGYLRHTIPAGQAVADLDALLVARESAAATRARAEGAAEALRGAGDDLLQVGLLAPNRIETSQWLHDRAARIARESR